MNDDLVHVEDHVHATGLDLLDESVLEPRRRVDVDLAFKRDDALVAVACLSLISSSMSVLLALSEADDADCTLRQVRLQMRHKWVPTSCAPGKELG